ncbi:MAG: hypothetical protein O3A00_22330 [Planctomycetota bacterium]|nr:hypothetical protein [Planctomycetota bacterium]
MVERHTGFIRNTWRFAARTARRLRNGLNFLLFHLKWPIAIIAVCAFPGAAAAMISLITRMVTSPASVWAFLLGMIIYLAIWWRLVRHSRITFLLVLEHEFTHALFAWLTFHRVTGLKATWRGGGQMEFMGAGNWLITISPYFFPTISALLLLGFWMFSDGGPVCNLALGISLAYHITSTIRETHSQQTDLQKVGYPFALLFLPTANLLMIGAVMSFTYGAGPALVSFFTVISETTTDLIAVVAHKIGIG